MPEPFLLMLFKVIWQDLVKNIGYDSTKHNWQAIKVVIDEIKNSKQVNQDLTVALEKCFYSSIDAIAQQCREELIKNSTFTQYRGAKIYKPPENDKDIRNLEKKIKLIEKQIRKNNNIPKLFNKSSFTTTQLEELLKELSEFSQDDQNNIIDDGLFKEAEKDCDVNIYKTTLRDKERGLRTEIFNNFLIKIESNKQLNSIFKARTHLILNQLRNQS